MEEQGTGFDQPVEPDTNDSGNPTEAGPGDAQKPRAPAGREMLIQLQQMIDTVALQAGPVLRDVAAKAAELAAVAGEKAGPLAHRAANVTESLGQRMALRSKEVAADLRRPRGEEDGMSSADQAADLGTQTPMSDSDHGSGESTSEL